MNWFRAHRRHIVAIAALAVMSLALVRYVCPWSFGTAAVSSVAIQSFTLTMSPDGFCGPEGCTFARTDSAASDQTLLTNPVAPLPLAVLFFVIGLFALTQIGARAHSFHRLPGYPPILEFYRLRI
jgi:ABC-type Na+ efflux pump permease subunit